MEEQDQKVQSDDVQAHIRPGRNLTEEDESTDEQGKRNLVEDDVEAHIRPGRNLVEEDEPTDEHEKRN